MAYWDYKFRTIESEDIEIVTNNGTETGAAKGPNDLQKAFGGYLAVASMVPNVTFLILNAFFGHRFKTQPRLIVSLIFVIIVFTFTSVMVMVDTDTWQSEFLTLTLVSVVFININTAIFQVCCLNDYFQFDNIIQFQSFLLVSKSRFLPANQTPT